MDSKPLNFMDAATEMEHLCETIDQMDDINLFVQQIFQKAEDDWRGSIDRRIKWLKYTESQIEMAKKSMDEWARRLKRCQRLYEYIKQNTLDTMKANPGLPYKGSLGAFKICKNSQPTIKCESLTPSKQTFESVVYNDKPEWVPYFEEVRFYTLDKAALKQDLKDGKKIPGITLEYGEHVRLSI